MSKIVHIDLNYFFAQVEILSDPSLKDKPVAIGYDGNRGVLSTCTYQARKFGISSGMPSKEAKRILPSLIIIPGNYRKYSQVSHDFFSFLKERYPVLMKVSIDECYIDMSENLKNMTREEEEDYLRDLQLQLYKTFSLKCSIGLGDTNFLAKMASDFRKPLGLTIIHKEDIEEYLFPLDISKMYGIGKKTAPRLKKMGINTIGDLYKSRDEDVISSLGSNYYYFIDALEAKSSAYVQTEYDLPKSISAERTFSSDVSDLEEILSMAKVICRECYTQLKRYKGKSKTVMIKYRTIDFLTHSKRVTKSEFFDSFDSMYQEIETLFEKYTTSLTLRLIGVGYDNVIYDTCFEDEEIKLF